MIASLSDKSGGGVIQTLIQIRRPDATKKCTAEIIRRWSESEGVSNYLKLVHNSQIAIRMIVRTILSRGSSASVAGRLHFIAKTLLEIPKFSSLGRSMIMFDALNELLADASGEQSRIGYRPIVRDLYGKLGDQLNGSSFYWLQRAKAAYNIETDPAALLEGIDFGKKAAMETESIRTADNAEFTIALLFGKLCQVTQYKEINYVTESVTRFSAAISNYSRNANYIRNLIIGGEHRRNVFELLCDHLGGTLSEPKLLPLRGEVSHLLEVRKNYARSHSRTK